VLRALPPSPENLDATERISRKHAKICFEAGGIVWKNLQCSGGTAINDRMLGPDGASLLSQNLGIEVADAVALRCDLFLGNGDENREVYRRFERSLNAVPTSANSSRPRAVRLRRLDALANYEEYLLFQGAISIGRDPACELSIADTSLSHIHARIHILADGLWLEPCQVRKPTLANGRQVPLDCLLPLVPPLVMQLGELEISVAPLQQAFLDFSPPAL